MGIKSIRAAITIIAVMGISMVSVVMAKDNASLSETVSLQGVYACDQKEKTCEDTDIEEDGSESGEVVSEAETQETVSETETREEVLPEAYTIENFPIIYQMPELPTGCEITAMTMVLNYYGMQADKVDLAVNYLPAMYSTGLYYGEDGRVYGNDINQYFIGDPTTEEGIICGTGAIVSAADQYLEASGSELRAEDRTGSTPEELYQLVSENVPVVVWCTIGMQDRSVVQGWYTESGEYVDWGTGDHGAVLVGYSSDTVTIADPISGLIEYDRAQFESVFASRGNRCVTIES